MVVTFTTLSVMNKAAAITCVHFILIAAAFVLLVPVMDLLAQTDTATTSTTSSEMDNNGSAVPSTSTEQTTSAAYPNLTDTYKKESLPSEEVYSDFVIGPGRFELEIEPGESRTVELIVSNRMGDRRLFSFEMEDMTGSEDGGETIKLLGEQEGPYTLRDYISVPHEKFYLDHAQRARIPVTITVPPDAEPGGRYGSLLTTMASKPNEQTEAEGAQPTSPIVSRIGTLFFVTVPGDIEWDSKLADFSTVNGQKIFWNGPIDFLLTSENTGSVHATPYGQLTITNLLGENVGSVQMQPWFVMPESVRTREISWNREFLIGRYTATVEVNRGYDNIVDEMTFSFWVIPWKIVGTVFAGLFILFLLLRAFFSRFEFKRK